MTALPFAALSAIVLLCSVHLTRASPPSPLIPSKWILAALGQSCTDACAARSTPAPCHLASLQSVTTELDFDRLRDSTLNHTDITCSSYRASQELHAPSLDVTSMRLYYGFGSCYLGTTASTCDAFNANVRRFCCCGDTPCSNKYVPRWQSEGLDIAAPAIHNNLDL
jgi:hypothetical protein